jgi:hypothetical protein
MEGKTIQLLSLIGMPREVAYFAEFFKRVEAQDKDAVRKVPNRLWTTPKYSRKTRNQGE